MASADSVQDDQKAKPAGDVASKTIEKPETHDKATSGQVSTVTDKVHSELKVADEKKARASENQVSCSAAAPHLTEMNVTAGEAHLTFDALGRVVRQATPHGNIELSYDGCEQRASKLQVDGAQWKSDDGRTFENGEEKRLLVPNPDGTLQFSAATVDAKLDSVSADNIPAEHQLNTTNPEAPTSDQIQATIESVAKSTGEKLRQYFDKQSTQLTGIGEESAYSYSPGFDVSTFAKSFAGKSQEEREAVDSGFQQTYGKSLEQVAKEQLSGTQLQDVLTLITKRDGDLVGSRESDLATIIDTGSSGWASEKNIRQILMSSTSSELRTMDEKFRADHSDKSLFDSLKSNANISDATKAMLDQVKDGSDKRTTDQTLEIAKVGLANKDIDIFSEAMSQASPEARAKFLLNGGLNQINETWANHIHPRGGGYVLQTTTESRHATDYALYGKLSAATQVNDAHGITTDGKAIDLALSSMSDEERQMFSLGKQLHEQQSKQIPEGLNADIIKQSLAYYGDLHGQLKLASNPTELVQREAEAEEKGGGFIASFAEHRRTISNDSTDKLRGHILNMKQADWQDLKDHPNKRADMAAMLKSLNKSDGDITSLMSTYDAKVGAADFNAANDIGKKPLLDALQAHSSGLFGAADFNNMRSSLLAIQGMTAEEQRMYRENSGNPPYREQVDKALPASFSDEVLQHASKRMLEQIKNGQAPVLDLAAQLELQTNSPQTIRDIEQWFRDDKSLFSRIQSPETEVDKQFAADFKTALANIFAPAVEQASLDPGAAVNENSDYSSYANTLLTYGKLSLEQSVSLNKPEGIERLASELAYASTNERQRLVTDTSCQQQLLKGLTDKEKEIALAAADKGQFAPEDRIRAAIIGWGGAHDVSSLTAAMKPGELATAEKNYAHYYHSDFKSDVLNKTSGQDSATAQRAFDDQLSFTDQQESARKEGLAVRTGFGAWLDDKVLGSSTGSQVDSLMNSQSAAFTNYEVRATNVSAQTQDVLDATSSFKKHLLL